MNNKIEIAFGKHIERLEADVKTTQNLKQISLLREGVIPKYSDTDGDGPEIVPSQFVNLLELVDESAAICRDLDLIDYGKSLVGVSKPEVIDDDFDYEGYEGYLENPKSE